MRVNAVEFGGREERGEGGPGSPAAVGPGEQGVFAGDRLRADGALDDVVVDFDPAVAEEALEVGATGQRVSDRLGELRLARDATEVGLPALEQIGDDRCRLLLPRALTGSRPLRRGSPPRDARAPPCARPSMSLYLTSRRCAQGATVRVPRVLYRKRIRASSAHARWCSASETELDEMWVVHCLETVAAIASVSPSAPFAPEFRAALLSRLAREEVRFARRSGWPEILAPDAGLLAMLSVYARVRQRTPHYSWLA